MLFFQSEEQYFCGRLAAQLQGGEQKGWEEGSASASMTICTAPYASE